MRQCEHCGSELRTNARFCGHCGKRVDNEMEATTNLDDSPIVDISVSPLTTTVVFNELQDMAPEDDIEEEKQIPPLVLEDNVAEEEQQPQLALEEDDIEEEKQTPPQAIEDEIEEEKQTPPHAVEDEIEVETQTPPLLLADDVEEERTDIPGLNSATSADLDAEPEGTAGDHKGPPHHSTPPSPLQQGIAAEKMESPANQVLDEQPQLDQTPSGKLAVLSSHVSGPGVKTRSSVPKVLLFLIAAFIIVSGCAAALIGLFQWHLPGTSGAASALSSSSISETINTAEPPLSASVCASSSTHATPGTSGGIGLTLSTPSGCSSFNITTATSLCLIYPYNPGALHKYILNVSNVTVDSKAYHLVLSIVEYSGSTSYNDGDHITIGVGEGSTGINFSWLYRSGNVTINSDEQSGTMDVILESASGGNAIHVVGGWMCGRLITIK